MKTDYEIAVEISKYDTKSKRGKSTLDSYRQGLFEGVLAGILHERYAKKRIRRLRQAK